MGEGHKRQKVLDPPTGVGDSDNEAPELETDVVEVVPSEASYDRDRELHIHIRNYYLECKHNLKRSTDDRVTYWNYLTNLRSMLSRSHIYNMWRSRKGREEEAYWKECAKIILGSPYVKPFLKKYSERKRDLEDTDGEEEDDDEGPIDRLLSQQRKYEDDSDDSGSGADQGSLISV